jgi:hypothetical protein
MSAEITSVHLARQAAVYVRQSTVEQVTNSKHAWLVQAAILHEAQARSIYGEETLVAVARRFEISLRQAEKYAAVWETFFASSGDEMKNVNVDAIALQEPSWYIVAASETRPTRLDRLRPGPQARRPALLGLGAPPRHPCRPVAGEHPRRTGRDGHGRGGGPELMALPLGPLLLHPQRTAAADR